MSKKDIWDEFQDELDDLRCEAMKLIETCDAIMEENKRLKKEIIRLKQEVKE